jgi:hypothetical protein
VTSRVLPDGSTQSPASTPANAGRSALREIRGPHAQRAGERSIDPHVELRLLSACREADVHRARHLTDRVEYDVRESAEFADVGTAHLDLNLFLLIETAACDCRRDAADLAEPRAQLRRDRVLMLVALGLRDQTDVDRALIDRAGHAADPRA